MAVTVRTIYPNQLYQFQVTDFTGNLEILRYTYTTHQLSSSFLPTTAVAILQARWDLLTSGIPDLTVRNFASLLGNLIHTSDPGGEIPFYFSSGGGINFVYGSGLNPAAAYYLNIGIPNSADLWLIGSPAIVPPV